jgi:hypothetical protein
MFTKRLSVSLFALSTVGAAAVAFASTSANTPGASCVASTGSLFNAVTGEAANLTASTVTAVCPIDRVIAPTVSTKVSAVVWVRDQNPSLDVCCTLNSKNPSGNLVSSPQVCSSGSSSSYQQLTLPQISDGYTYSHYYVQCSIPGTSGGAFSELLTYRSVQD